MEKEKYLRKIDLLVAENKCNEAIITAIDGYKQYKDDCFLDKTSNIYISIGNRKEAIKYLEKIYKNDSNNLSNIKKLGYNYFALGNFKKALKYYKQVLDFEPQNSENYFNIASMYHFLKKNK